MADSFGQLRQWRRMGVWPRGYHVRQAVGSSEKPRALQTSMRCEVCHCGSASSTLWTRRKILRLGSMASNAERGRLFPERYREAFDVPSCGPLIYTASVT